MAFNPRIEEADMVENFDLDRVRADFPALNREMNGKPLIYLDTAASALKPQCVIDAMSDLMGGPYANIHRGLYEMSQTTTSAYEGARKKIAEFIGAHSDNEIIFTRNGTEAINLVAQSWGRQHLGENDIVLLSELEHHANIVPWHMLREERGVILEFVPVDDQGNLDLESYRQKIQNPSVKMAAFAHISNALGTVLPIKEMIALARDNNVTTLVDGCQGVMHGAVNVQDLGCDFYTFSGHKLYGPSGIGVLYGREDLLNAMPPYQGGGDMIERVSYEHVDYQKAPARFEAGTPAIVEAVGLGRSTDYLLGLGWAAISTHENDLYDHLCEALGKIEGLKLIGAADERVSVASFVVDGVHPHDLGTLLDKQGVAVRVGHHCAEPLMKRLNVPSGTVRASIGLYNSHDDVEAFIAALKKAKMFF